MEVIEIPIYGSIAAGYPDGVEQGDAVGRIQIDTQTLGLRQSRKAFALRVRGDSMVDAGIFDGDTVVLDPRPPRHNDIVAALIDGETTLKRFMSPPHCPPYLKAENVAYPELYPVDELIVQGVAQAVVRRL
jgi:repressor LexA